MADGTQQEDRWRITVAGWAGAWLILDPGDGTTAETTQEPDGGNDDYEVLGSKPRHADITLTRGFKPDRDTPIMKRYRSKVGSWETVVTQVPLDGDGVALTADAITYHVKLKGLTAPPVNHRSQNAVSDIRATFAVRRIS